MIRFVVPGLPQGKGRPRAVRIAGKARMATPKATVAYEGLIAHSAMHAMAGQAPISGPVAVRMVAIFPVPPSWSKTKRAQALAGVVRPTGKPDVDNVLKAIGDGCNGVVWVDDSAVVDVVATKRFGVTPGVQVTVEPLAAIGRLTAFEQLLGAF